MEQEPIYCDVCSAAGQKTIGFKKMKLKHPITGELLMEQNFCKKCYLIFLKQSNEELDKLISEKAIREATSRAGKAGTGKSKSRGDSEYYSRIASLPRKRKNAKK